MAVTAIITDAMIFKTYLHIWIAISSAEVVRQNFKEIHRQKKQTFHKRLRDPLSIKVAMRAFAKSWRRE
jgi:hypothetical protein